MNRAIRFGLLLAFSAAVVGTGAWAAGGDDGGEMGGVISKMEIPSCPGHQPCMYERPGVIVVRVSPIFPNPHPTPMNPVWTQGPVADGKAAASSRIADSLGTSQGVLLGGGGGAVTTSDQEARMRLKRLIRDLG